MGLNLYFLPHRQTALSREDGNGLLVSHKATIRIVFVICQASMSGAFVIGSSVQQVPLASEIYGEWSAATGPG